MHSLHSDIHILCLEIRLIFLNLNVAKANRPGHLWRNGIHWLQIPRIHPKTRYFQGKLVCLETRTLILNFQNLSIGIAGRNKNKLEELRQHLADFTGMRMFYVIIFHCITLNKAEIIEKFIIT